MYTIEEEQDHTTITTTASSTFVVQGVAQRDIASADNVRRALVSDVTAQLHGAVKEYLSLPSSTPYPDLDVTFLTHTTPLSAPSILRHADSSITRTSGLTTLQVVASAAIYK